MRPLPFRRDRLVVHESGHVGFDPERGRGRGREGLRFEVVAVGREYLESIPEVIEARRGWAPVANARAAAEKTS